MGASRKNVKQMLALCARMSHNLWGFAQECQINGALRARTSNKCWRFAQNGRKNHSLKEERVSAVRSAADARSSINEWFFRPFCAKRQWFTLLREAPTFCFNILLRDAPHWYDVLARSATTYVTFLREASTFLDSCLKLLRSLFYLI